MLRTSKEVKSLLPKDKAKLYQATMLLLLLVKSKEVKPLVRESNLEEPS
jgi:hypothetical protein